MGERKLSVALRPVVIPELGEIRLGSGNRISSVSGGIFLLANKNEVFAVNTNLSEIRAERLTIPIGFYSDIESIKSIVLNSSKECYRALVAFTYVTGEILVSVLVHDTTKGSYVFASSAVIPAGTGHHHVSISVPEYERGLACSDISNSIVILCVTTAETGEIQMYPIRLNDITVSVGQMKHWYTKMEPLASLADGVVRRRGDSAVDVLVFKSVAISRNMLEIVHARSDESDKIMGTDFYNVNNRYFDEEQCIGELIKCKAETSDLLTAVTCSNRGLRKLLQIKYTYKGKKIGKEEDEKIEEIIKPPTTVKFNELVKDEKRSLKGRASIMDVNKVLTNRGSDITESLLVAVCGLGEISLTNVPFKGSYVTEIERVKGVPVGCALERQWDIDSSEDAGTKQKTKSWKLFVATDEGGCFLGTVKLE